MPFLTSQSSNFVEVHSLNTPPDGQSKKKAKYRLFSFLRSLLIS